MSESKSGWILHRCPSCGRVTSCDGNQSIDPTCPDCGAVLDVSDSNRHRDGQSESAASAPSRAAPVLKVPLISNLGIARPDDPQLDQTRLKRTTDEELVSAAANRVRIKRKSQRVEKELTSWDERGTEVQPAKRGRRKRTAAWWNSVRIAAIAIVPVGMLVLTVYGLIASMRVRDEDPPPNGPATDEASLARAALSELEAAAMEDIASEEIYAKSKEVAEKFLDANSWEERLAYVRDPERVRPLMEQHYSRPGNDDGPVLHREIPEKAEVLVHLSYLMLAITMPDFSVRPLAIERISEDQFLVDWESWVGYCGVPWTEFDTHRPTEPFVLRARVFQRNYFNFGFRDDTWASWQLEDRAGDHRIYGYVGREDPKMIELVAQTEDRPNPATPVYLLLKVRFPENAPSADQVEITEMIGRGWILPREEG